MIKTFIQTWMTKILIGALVVMLTTTGTLYVLYNNSKAENEILKTSRDTFSQSLLICGKNSEEYRTEIEYLKSIITIMRSNHGAIEDEFETIQEQFQGLRNNTTQDRSNTNGSVNEGNTGNTINLSDHFRLLRQAGCSAGADC